MDLVVCLKTSILAVGRESLIFSAVCTVFIFYLSSSVRRRLTQRITIGVLIVFLVMLMLGSAYVKCLEPLLL